MVFSFKSGSFAKSTTTTGFPFTQAITGVGFQPKGVFLYSARQTTQTGAYTDGFDLCLGVCGGTTDALNAADAVKSLDAATSANTGMGQLSSAASLMFPNDSEVVVVQAKITAFGADGFTLTYAANDSAASIINYVAFGGTDITNITAGKFNAPGSIGNQDIVVAGSFQPDFVLFSHTASDGADNVQYTGASIGLGFGVSSTKRAAFSVVSVTSGTNMDTYRYQRIDKCIVVQTEAGGAVQAEADYSPLATGFRLNWSSVNLDYRIKYIAIKGGQFDVGNFTTPTAGTPPFTTDYTAQAFQPVGVILASVGQTAQTTVQAQNRASIGAADSSTSRNSIAIGDEDAVGTALCAKATDNTKVLRMPATIVATGSSTTSNIVADFSAFLSNGFRLNYTTRGTANAYQVIYAAFGSTAVVGNQYDRSPTPETITVSDASLDRIKSALRIPTTETTTVTAGTATRETQAFRTPTTDTTTISDSSLTRTRTAVAVPSADTSTVSDVSLTRMLSSVRNPTADSTVSGESITRNTQAFRLPSTDTTTVVDATLTRSKQIPRLPSTDSTTVVDSSLTRIKSALRIPTADTTTVTAGTATRATQAFRSPSADTTISTEQVSGGKLFDRDVPLETITVTDSSLNRLLSAIRIPVTDTISIIESSLVRSKTFPRVPTVDTSTVVDASLTRAKTISRVPSADSTTVLDFSLTRLLSMIRSPSADTATISDASLTRLYSGLRIPNADTIGLSENVTGQKIVGGVNYTRVPPTETTTVLDGVLSRLVTFLRVPSTEIVNIVESALTRLIQAFRSPSSDTTGVTDVSLVRVISKSRVLTPETIPITDSSLSRLLSALRTPSQDTSVVSDASLIRRLQLVRVPNTDTTALSENVSKLHTTAGQYNRNVSDIVAIQELSLTRLLSLRRFVSTDTSVISENLQRAKIIPRAPGTDSINITDASLVRSLTAIRIPTSDISASTEASLVRLLSAFRSPTADTTTVSELQSLISFSKSLQDTVNITEPLLQRIVTRIRELTDSTDMAESVFFETYKRLVFDSVVVAEQLFSIRQALSGSVTYAIPEEVRPLLGNLGAQRTDDQINLAIDAAYDEINTRTNRIPPNDWKNTDHNFGVVQKLARYIAAKEMAIGIKDFDTKPLDMEIERLFNILLTYDTSSDATADIVGSSPDITYALNESGVIWSTRYPNLRKRSSGENDTTINPNT